MKIHHIFLSLDGEVNAWGQGIPSVFLRLQGCNARPLCSYCDIPEAQDPRGGRDMTVDEVLRHIRAFECPKVTITGGEPLLQEDEVHELLNRLFPHGYTISIETNGTLSTRRFRDMVRPYDRVSLVVDHKFTGNIGGNPDAFSHLIDMDWVKIVVGGREDFDEALAIFKWIRGLGCRARFALSPVHETLPGKVLAQWMLDAKLWDVTLNCQIHKWLGLK